MTAHNSTDLSQIRHAALKYACYFKKPCFIFDCGNYFTYRIGNDAPPEPGAKLIETTRTGIRFPLKSGAVFRIAITVKV